LKFNSYTTDDWKKNYSSFADRLIAKAKDLKLDTTSLKKALNITLSDALNDTAYLPVGAYQIRLGNQKLWIVVVKWEYLDNREDRYLDHIRIYAYNQKTLERIAQMSCD